MTAVAGRKAIVYVSGAGVAFTDEATTVQLANTQYRITDSTKQVWDRSATITVKKDGVAQSSTLYTLNRLLGYITFLADIGGGHTITVSGTYLPMSQAAQAKNYSYTLKAANLNVSKFGDVWVPRIQGLKDISGSLSAWKSDTYFSAALMAGSPVVLELWSDSTTNYDYRVWALLDQAQIQSAVAGAVEVSVNFNGTTDTDLHLLTNN